MRLAASPPARFLLRFLALLGALFGMNLLQPVQQHLVLPWTTWLAGACAWLVTAFDGTARASGKVLWNAVTGFGVSIEPGCNGIEACIVLAAGVLAFPASARQRAVGLAAGFVAIQAVNTVRVVSLFYLGQWSPQAFRFAHEYLWQALIMVDVLAVWLAWARWVRRLPAEPAGRNMPVPAAP